MGKTLLFAGMLIVFSLGNPAPARAAEPCVWREVHYNLEGAVRMARMCFSNDFRASASLDGQTLEVRGFGKDGVRMTAAGSELLGGIYSCRGGRAGNGPLYVTWEAGMEGRPNNAGVYAACKEQKEKDKK